ncbi:MAG: FtsW/RodA/SpoVE family cell cycle protein [Armatimonadetes bacterium]|nr:FtsW/RodA/SpoVE family cell cycle protein [Armatimonadota bacterium]
MSRPADRRHEGRWLRQVGWCLAAFYVALAGHRWLRGGVAFDPREVAVLGGFIGGLHLLHEALAATRLRGDQAVVPLVGLLTGLGLLMRLRLATPETAWNWHEWLIIPAALAALAGSVWACRRHLTTVEAAGWLAGFLALGLLLFVVRHGVSFRGATFGPGRTTPTELLKPLMVICLAGFLKRPRALWELTIFGALFSAVLLLLVKQSDLGMVVILGALTLSLWFVSTGQSRWLLVGLSGAAVVLLLLSMGGSSLLGSAAQRPQRRVDAWLDPWQDPHGNGYQTMQAVFAQRAGGLDGAGLGGGQAQLVPLVRSDFAWAELAEDLGLMGCALVLCAYLALYRRGYRIASLAEHPFRQRLAVGCVTVLAIQTLLNLGGVVRLVPITGITLPFISHGGSSLLVSYCLIGLLLAVGDDLEFAETSARPGRRDGAALATPADSELGAGAGFDSACGAIGAPGAPRRPAGGRRRGASGAPHGRAD